MRPIHNKLKLNGSELDPTHLNSFTISFNGKGKTPNSNLVVAIEISCHVYSERCSHGQPPDFFDSLKNPRQFSQERFDLSLGLPSLIEKAILEDKVVFMSRDYNGTANLALFDLGTGKYYQVIFYFEPSNSQNAEISLKIVSAYSKRPSKNAKGNKLSFFARQCLFSGKRIP